MHLGLRQNLAVNYSFFLLVSVVDALMRLTGPPSPSPCSRLRLPFPQLLGVLVVITLCWVPLRKFPKKVIHLTVMLLPRSLDISDRLIWGYKGLSLASVQDIFGGHPHFRGPWRIIWKSCWNGSRVQLLPLSVLLYPPPIAVFIQSVHFYLRVHFPEGLSCIITTILLFNW